MHLDLHFDVRDERVIVTQNLSLKNVSSKAVTSVALDAKRLVDVKIQMYQKFTPLGESKSTPLDFPGHVASFQDLKEVKSIDIGKESITVELGATIDPGKEFVLKTINTVIPTANILEGIYYDFTLKGMPKTMITQCQQYGFQRICPAIDRMSAKAFFTTTIVADERYTNMISNGDLAPGFFKLSSTGEKVPVFIKEKDGDSKLPSRKVIKYYNHKVNMASYLFFFGVGIYETYTKTLEYPDGSCVDLQLLSLPTETGLTEERKKRRTDQYMAAIQAVHDSVLWTYHSTGPETCEHNEERKEVKRLIDVRETLKAKEVKGESVGEELKKVRADLKKLMGAWKETGYKYTGQTYREIGMQNSNYGGMENVGNTTILQSRLAPTDFISDGAYIYMEAVKIHEFYHNINGSQVTGMTPFEIWLNEAVTVHMERKRSSEIFGEGHIRLSQAARAFIPGSGPLASDSGPRAMPVEPEGFNVTNELITGMTYFKAPEFTRMTELLMGTDLFSKGLHRYHDTYKNSNATSIQWVEAMEDTMKDAGKPFELKVMAHGWLKRSGHPHVTVTVDYDEKSKKLSVKMTQTGFESIKQTMAPEEKGGPWDFGADFKAPWKFPVCWAVVKDGKDTHSGMHIMQKESEVLVVENVNAKPDFFSFARGFSYFGTYSVTTATNDDLALQASTDPDLVNRFLAYRAIADKEKGRLVQLRAKGTKLSPSDVSKEYVTAHASIMQDEKLEGAARALITMEPESVDSLPSLRHQYWYISEAKSTMLAAVFLKHQKEILAKFDTLEKENKAGPHKDQLHERALKGHYLRLAAAATKFEAKLKSEVIPRAERLATSAFMTDRIRGVLYYLTLCEEKERDKKLEQLKKSWGSHMDSCEELVGIISSIDSDDSPKIIEALLSDDIFDINLAGHARRVVRNWAHNRKRSVLTDAGLKLTEILLVTVGKVNQMSAYALLDAFGDVAKFDETQKKKMLDTLKSAQSKLDPSKYTSLYNQIGRLLASTK
eukprot:CAMPEP_0167761716 /NCGR_PEP_ID=MMETSP0110_2-20121227/12336_1 /TAXON_ID=629695 /ORGANISM="Gymnochlora sp., Strain CCMP2014" /LENGTH=1000 /DNA_ID=CAMNT_0007648449 /DNA_START=1 /DNA_END=3003 /DNA_ORIENTATION=+